MPSDNYTPKMPPKVPTMPMSESVQAAVEKHTTQADPAPTVVQGKAAVPPHIAPASVEAAIAAETAANDEVLGVIDELAGAHGVDADDPIYAEMTPEQLDERGLARQWFTDDDGNLASKIVLAADYIPAVSTNEHQADWSALPRAVLEHPKFSELSFRLECEESYGLAGATSANGEGFRPIQMDRKLFKGTSFTVGTDGYARMGDLTLWARPKEQTIARARVLALRNAKMLEESAQLSIDAANDSVNPRYTHMQLDELKNEVQMRREDNPYPDPPENPFEGLSREEIEARARGNFENAVRIGQQHDTKGRASFFFANNPIGPDRLAERKDKEHGKRDLYAEALGAVGG